MKKGFFPTIFLMAVLFMVTAAPIRPIQLGPIERNAIGTTSTDALVLINPAPATVGAQQISPRARWTGSGWKTDATAGSQVVDYIAELVPVQGAANPQARLDFNYQINAGGYQSTPTMSLLDGKVGIGTKTPNANEIYNRLTVGGTDSTALSLGIENAGIGQSGLIIRRTGGTLSRWSIYTPGASTSLRFFNGTDILELQPSGNVGLNTSTFGTSAAKVLAIGSGTAPTTSPADAAQFWVADVNAEVLKASFMMRSEISANGNGAIVGAFIKNTTGDFASGYEGMVQLNTVDNTIKMYSNGIWESIKTALVAARPISTKTNNYTLTSSDDTILADASSALIIITLPTAVSIPGKEYTIKKIDNSANTVQIATTSSQTIDMATTQDILNQNVSITVRSDGSNWFIF